ncbi:MAG: HD domain-containing protein [Clostridia bacterium]|nr:HD domain-containing protein [Clostridia bacterium]MDD4386966.1 HD domain-containing protein [Clostridia bacterium]
MNKVLWVCVITNIVYSFFEFKNIISPAYIIVLLLLIILIDGNKIKLVNLLSIITAIVGIILSIYGIGTIMIIISGIAIILEVIQGYFLVSNGKKYDKSLGINEIKEKEIEDIKIVTEYNIDRIRDTFDNFIKDYDKTNHMIDMKYKHAIDVANNALNIARSIGLDEEGRYLAYIVGILHDIGKFEQVKLYKTLDDTNTVDHVNYGCDILKNGLIRQFINENKYDEIIIKTIQNHNKFCIDSSFSDDEKLYCSILRDSDKLDVFKRLSEGQFEDNYNVTKDMIISPEISLQINKKHPIEFSLGNNNLDKVLLRLSMIYDINYAYTLKTIKQNDYLNKYIVLIDTIDYNKLILKNILNDLYEYIDNKLK